MNDAAPARPTPHVGPTGGGRTTAAGRRRRAAILDAAAERFLAVGFAATSIDEVGAAAGISGPGVYRHVASKDELLTAVLDRLWFDGFGPAVEAAADLPPRRALASLTDAHVRLALGQRTALVVLVTELRHLPASYRDAADRSVTRYVDAWVTPLRALRPDVDEDEARAVAVAVHGLVDAAARTPELLDQERRAVLLRGLVDGVIDRFAAGDG